MNVFGKKQEGWTTATQKLGEWQTINSVETELETFMKEWRHKEAAGTPARHTRVAAKTNPTPHANTGTGVASSR